MRPPSRSRAPSIPMTQTRTQGASTWKGHGCLIEAAHHRLSRRWTLPIALTLLDGPVSFSELRRRLAPISANMLVKRLRALEKAGIVCREVAERGAYSLTSWGGELSNVRFELLRWIRSGEHPR